MGPVDRIWEFLQRLSPLTRSCLLSELERLELSGVDMPGSADIQARLRAEIQDGREPTSEEVLLRMKRRHGKARGCMNVTRLQV
ncbi:MAG: hypothetical protein ACK46T_23080, partial [Bradyrhizobium sp.]